MSVDISVVILTWNSERYLATCLKTLLSDLELHSRSYQVYVVDNGSKDETVSLINRFYEKYPKGLLPISLRNNYGTTKSRNMALKKAAGKYILIMDSDVSVSPGAVEVLIRTLELNSRIGITAPLLTYPDGTLQKSTDVFPTVFTKMWRLLFLKTMEKQQNPHNTKGSLVSVDYAISAVWLMKREILNIVGLLDENIFYSPEDIDYCFRVKEAGFEVVINTESRFIHDAQEISRGFRFNRAKLEHAKGLAYYFWKHRYVFRKPRLPSSL